MMNASAVKPALPTGGVQPPKVGLGAPPSSTASSPPSSAAVSPPKQIVGPPNTTGSPAKLPAPININHAPSIPCLNAPVPAPLSLVQEHKSPISGIHQQQSPPVGLIRPERKEYQFSPAPVVKPTSNGVEGSPVKASPTLTVSQPVELKKPDDEPVVVAPVNHSVDPVKLPATPPQLQAVVPPAPLIPITTPPTALPPSPTKQEPAAQVTTNHTNKVAEVSGDIKPVLLPTPTPPLVIPPPIVQAPVVPPPSSPATPQVDVVVSPPLVAAVDSTPKPVVADITKIRSEAAKPEFKVATPPRNNKRKKEPKTPDDAKPSTSDEDDRKSKRVRIRTQPYQSPIPELTFIAKTFKTLTKSPDDKLIVFYKNEFLAVRNSDGGFYVCQAMQNIYKSSPRIRIRWLSQEKKDNKVSDVYIPDFYDQTDFDCILTNLELKKMDKNRFQLPAVERERTENILKRALDVEKGVSEKSPVTEEHPDGLDLSLFRDESQLKKRKKGSKKGVKNEEGDDTESDEDDDDSEEESSDKEEDKKKVVAKPSAKKVEKPRAPIKEKAKPKEVVKKTERVSEREKRGSTSKRRSEPIPPAVTPTGRTARPPPEKKATPAKPVKKSEPALENAAPTRSAKTRSVRAAVPTKSLPATRTKEPRKVATPAPVAKGKKKPGKKV